MTVGGWFDAEDLFGALDTYKTIEETNPGARNTLVMGPWFHGGWARSDGDALGSVSFGQKTSLAYRETVELPFFNCLLKDKCESANANAGSDDVRDGFKSVAALRQLAAEER